MPTESPDDYFRRRMELLSSVPRCIAFPNEKGHKMAKTQQQLLDELDEARHELRAYRRGWVLDLLGLAVSLTSIIGGTILTTTTAQAILFILLGVLGLILAICFACFWLDCHTPNSKSDSPAVKLRAAERAYRNSMLEQS